MPQDTKPRPNVAIDLGNKRAKQPASRAVREIMHREIIVCGDDPLAKTVAKELRGAGARIIQIATAADLLGAGVHRARLRSRRDARLKAGDTVYLIGPYRELIATLRKGQPPPLTGINGGAATLAAARSLHRPQTRPPLWAPDTEV
jgi:hypothetical protein